MFILIVLLTFALIAYLALRDWVFHRRLSSKAIQKILNFVSQRILLGDWEGARSALSPVLETEKGGKLASLYEIQVLRGTKQLEEAYLKTLIASRQFPEELLFRLEEGKILLLKGEPESALEAFFVCTPIIRSEEDLLAFAEAYLFSGFADEALGLLEPALKSTQNGHLLATAAECYFVLKHFHLAVPFYFRAIELGWKTHHIYVQLAHAQRRLGNLAEAEKIFRSLLEKDSSDVDSTLGLGACLEERGQFQKALLIYQSGSAWETNETALLKQAALCALKIKKYFYAERYFFESLQKEEPSPQTWAYYGYSLECQKKWQEAEQTYLKMVHLFPSDANGYLALAWLFGVGLSVSLTPNQGVNFAHIALKLKNDPAAWEILSAVEARVGNFAKAMQIQEALASFEGENDKQIRARRNQALRNLRKNIPLDNAQVAKTLVA